MSQPPMSRALAAHILARMGEAGQPPDRGVELINVGNERVLEVLDAEYLRPIAEEGRGSSFKLVQGHYGGGKTHFLLCLRERAWRRGLAVAIVGLSPEECPLDDPLKVWLAIGRELSLAPPAAGAPPVRGLEASLVRLVEGIAARVGPAEAPAALQAALRRLPCEAPAVRTAVLAFGEAVLRADPVQEERAAAWLRGEELGAVELRALGLRELPSRSSGMRYLRGLCQVLVALGVPGLVLAFDELDRNLSMTERRRAAVADQLRQLVDLCGREQLPGLLCLHAAPPEFMRLVVQEYPALQQRLEAPRALSLRSPQSPVIDLERLELSPRELLVQIGLKLLPVFELARGARLDRALQEQNLRLLAEELLAGSFELAHRRAFVKAAIDLFYEQAGQERLADGDHLRRLAGEGGRLVLLPGAPDPRDPR